MTIQMVKDLKNASKKNDAPIWLKLAKSALKSNSNQKTINLKKINENSNDGNAVVIKPVIKVYRQSRVTKRRHSKKN